MELFPNYNAGRTETPGDWARAREAEGWHGVAASDHFLTMNLTFPHLWVALTEMALATQTIRITSSFANNLFRSPVEFAQAAMTLNRVAKGRFEAGWGGRSREVGGDRRVPRARRRRPGAPGPRRPSARDLRVGRRSPARPGRGAACALRPGLPVAILRRAGGSRAGDRGSRGARLRPCAIDGDGAGNPRAASAVASAAAGGGRGAGVTSADLG